MKRAIPRKRHPLAGALRAARRIHRVVKTIDRWTGRIQNGIVRTTKKVAKATTRHVKGWVKAHRRAGVAVKAHARQSRPALAQRPTKKRRTPVQQRPATAATARQPASKRRTPAKRPAVQQRPSEAALLLGKEIQRINDEQWQRSRIERRA